jgi:predicted transglutaminase-like cysteine proteinase
VSLAEAKRWAGGEEIAMNTAVQVRQPWSTLKRVNAQVNSLISPKSDGRIDVWTVNARAGDCEDYVLSKRKKLIAAGLPASALRIAHVKTSSGEDHAILVVMTDKGKFVLDNLSKAVRPLSQTRYRVLAMQTANPKNWI